MSREARSVIGDKLTSFSSFDFLCRNANDKKDLKHNPNDDFCHSRSRWNFGVVLESPEKILDSIKEVEECALARAITLNRLVT